MKNLKWLIIGAFAASMLSLNAPAAEKAQKLTCCQEAKAKGTECKHKCCIAAHQAKKSCEKCNPNKEDMPKDPKKGGK